MASVQDFANGANILQQVDVSQIFKSLAMGIAEAQAELDDNSISQLQRLSETELAGKSLLELGFVPAFYSFTYADISASINLRMAEKTSFELGAEASFDFASNSTAAEDFSDLSKESQFQSEKGEFKSNRKFSMKSSSTKKIKVNNQDYQLNQSEGCIKKFESLHDSLLQDEHIERVNMQYSKAYTTVFENKSDYSIVAITDLTTGNVMPSPHTCLGANFAAVFSAITITPKHGFSGSQIFGLSTSPLEFEFFFDFDKKVIDFNYDETYTGINNKDLAFESFATILKNDPSLHVTIEGYTDSRGDVAYNKNLSTDRCNAMKTWLVSKGANPVQFTISAKDETLAIANGPDEVKNPLFRKVRIVLPPNRHYIIFSPVIVGLVTAGPNYFYSVPLATSSTFVVVNGNASGFQAGNSMATYQSLNAGSSNSLFHSETRNSLLYLLDKETEVTYMAYSSDSEEIKIVAEEGSQSEIKVYSNENNKERIKSLATKNGSNKTFAASASIDFRMSRQFEMSMEGSASMSARLVAVPPPDEFKTHIATIFNP